PCIVEVELRQESGFDDAEIARQLADPDRFRWSFSSPDGETSFDTVEAAGGTLLLTYRGNASFAPDSDGHYAALVPHIVYGLAYCWGSGMPPGRPFCCPG